MTRRHGKKTGWGCEGQAYLETVEQNHGQVDSAIAEAVDHDQENQLSQKRISQNEVHAQDEVILRLVSTSSKGYAARRVPHKRATSMSH